MIYDATDMEDATNRVINGLLNRMHLWSSCYHVCYASKSQYVLTYFVFDSNHRITLTASKFIGRRASWWDRLKDNVAVYMIKDYESPIFMSGEHTYVEVYKNEVEFALTDEQRIRLRRAENEYVQLMAVRKPKDNAEERLWALNEYNRFGII